MVSGASERYRRLYGRALTLRNRNRATRWLARRANSVLGVRPPTTFSGWGMTTEHQLPWVDAHRWSTFRESLERVRQFEFTGEAGISADTVDSLAWRHWVVALAVELSMTTAARHDPVHAVECGVADGTTAYVAGRELERLTATSGVSWTLHLYDSWSTMATDTLLPSERQQRGRYSNLSIDMTRRNLAEIIDRCELNVGYVPASFEIPPGLPDEIAFVHIDLNAAVPTRQCCEVLWPRVAPGGVMLFDDYGWLGFEDTKEVVDEIFAALPGSLLKWPTGQAMFVRTVMQ